MINPKRIGYSVGDPAGIGADIILALAQKPFDAQIVVFGCPENLSHRAKHLGLDIELNLIDYTQPIKKNGCGVLDVHAISLPNAHSIGVPDIANRDAIIDSLKALYQACVDKKIDALVTGPVSKSHLHTEKNPFIGHTEFFAQCAGVQDVMMSFYHPKCLVGLLTTHIPLKDVSAQITASRLQVAMTLLHQSLIKDFGIKDPLIATLGLNPHAGENGQLGQEEEDIIKPTLEKLRKQGIRIDGPIAGDTAFLPHNLEKFDGLLAMYHDQGLAPLKALGFGDLVNYTLGLPVIRTSVDHGTAFDIAGKHMADPSGLQSAIRLAMTLCQERTNGSSR